MPVPFVMEPGRTSNGEPAFLEPEGYGGNVLWAVAALFIFMGLLLFIGAILLAANPSSPFQWQLAGIAGLSLMVAVVLIAVARRLRTTARRLIFHSKELRLAIQTVRTRGRVESEAVEEIGRCRLTMHPVELIGPAGITFNGWMARVMVGDRCFALACCKQKAEVLAYMHRLPAWLLAISTGEGEKVVGQLSDRRFGNKPVRV